MKNEISKKQLSQILIDLDQIRYIIKYIDFLNEIEIQKRITEDFNNLKELFDSLNKE